MNLTVIPAYGLDYKSKAEVQADWDANKDFQIQDISCPWNGSYINKDQMQKGDKFSIRYHKLTKVVILTKE